MKLLEEKIRSEGKALSETVLKVDGFINHQVDPVLMSEIGKTLASYYKDKGVTKVFTIESSGIAPGCLHSHGTWCTNGNPEEADIQDTDRRCIPDQHHFLHKGNQL